MRTVLSLAAMIVSLGGVRADEVQIEIRRIVNGEPGLVVHRFRLVVDMGPPPSPAPLPNPIPPPPLPPQPPAPPPLPEGRFGLAAKAKQWTMTTVPADTARPKEAAALADAFDAVAARIAAGTITRPLSVLSALKGANAQALGQAAGRWRKWGEQFAAEGQRLYSSSKLGAPDDWRAALSEIAIGLRAVQ